jgi:hypothetical protein
MAGLEHLTKSMTLVDAVFEARIAALEALRRFTRAPPPRYRWEEFLPREPEWSELSELLAADDRLAAAEAALRADTGGSSTIIPVESLNGIKDVEAAA